MEVGRRLGLDPRDVLAWNAAKFYGVVECLCNLTAEEEAAVEDTRRRVRRERLG